MDWKLFSSLLLASLLPPPLVLSKTQEMTVTVAAGGEECFYEAVQAGQVLDVDYQVKYQSEVYLYVEDRAVIAHSGYQLGNRGPEGKFCKTVLVLSGR